MLLASRIFAGIAGLLHIWIFMMESVLWMDPAIHGRFRVPSVEQAEILRNVFFNQGFYNLFLALGALYGAVFFTRQAGARAVMTFASLRSGCPERSSRSRCDHAGRIARCERSPVAFSLRRSSASCLSSTAIGMPVLVLMRASTCRSGSGSSRASTSRPRSAPSAAASGGLVSCSAAASSSVDRENAVGASEAFIVGTLSAPSGSGT